jgi:pimeloyl-ACP methyl ester carboxylesterase
MGNGADSVTARVHVTDEFGQPLIGIPIILRASATFVTAGPQGTTDASGTAALVVRLTRAYPHFGTSAGPVTISAFNAGNGRALPATASLTVYNRVVVLLQGLGTSLSCTIEACHDRPFSQISADALTPIGYNLNGDGLHRTELEYSYRGGSMVPDPSGAWQWLIHPYSQCDSAQPLAASDAALRTLLLSYRQRYPYTTFELIGHSLGGVVALDTLAGDGGAFLSRLGAAAVDKVVTLDSPVNGIDSSYAPILLAGVLGNFSRVRTCTAELFGASMAGGLIRIGQNKPATQEHWAATLRQAGVEVLNMTNRDDQAVPEPYAIIDDGSTSHVADRMRFSLGVDRTAGHGTVLSRFLVGGVPNPAWPVLVSTLQHYLTDSCMAFAGATSSCAYPTINQGF